MNCAVCGETLREGAQVCDVCGATVKAAEPTAEPANDSTDQDQDTQDTIEASALIGKVIGAKYQLTALLGGGGMGSVFRARRLHIGDDVAVKVLHRKFVSEPKTVERFRREAQAAALIRHPTVVAIYDFSEARDGEPAYIVMELVEGKPLRKILETEGRLSLGRAVSIMREICKGVGAAHRLNVIHRDIKPDNIMILPPDSDDGRERVKVVDFGIAKLRDMAANKNLTQTGRVVGTVYYMSPEQCCAEHLDPRSDVYSLGIVFYELLAGSPPFIAEAATAIVAKHLTQPAPPLPKELNLPPEVEAVLRRALEKDKQLRQSDASAFGKELVAAFGTPEGGATTEHQNGNSEAKTLELKEKNASAGTKPRAPEDGAGAGEEKAAEIRQRAARSLNLLRWASLSLIALLILAALFFFWRKSRVDNHGAGPQSPTPVTENQSGWQQRLTLQADSKVYAVAFSPDDSRLATANSQGLREDREFISEIRIWNTATGQLEKTLTDHSDGILSVAFSPDGLSLASVSGTGQVGTKIGKVKLWDAQTGGLKWAITAHTDFATSVAFSPDGHLIASGSWDRTVKLWDAQTGNLQETIAQTDKVYQIAFSPDGKLLAVANQKNIVLWNVESSKIERELSGNKFAIAAVAFSKDGQWIAGGGVDGSIDLWDTQTGALKQTLKGHGDIVDSVAFAPDGKLLASGSYDSTVILWNLQTMTAETTLQESDKVTSVSFSHNGHLLASGSWAKTIHVWK